MNLKGPNLLKAEAIRRAKVHQKMRWVPICLLIEGTIGQQFRLDVLHRCCTESPAMDDKPWKSAVLDGAD